uniref:Uncharacterized protein n=1 Tax=Psilocybe cubensis TaxID=181762 RepID=A0A8H8CJV9_PSICU
MSVRTSGREFKATSLPNPVKVILSDSTSFIHWTTSPKSLPRLTRDITNNPLRNTGNPNDRSLEDENNSIGRMGRFSRRFEVLGSDLDDSAWMEEMSTVMKREVLIEKEKPKPKSKK